MLVQTKDLGLKSAESGQAIAVFVLKKGTVLDINNLPETMYPYMCKNMEEAISFMTKLEKAHPNHMDDRYYSIHKVEYLKANN